jgi:hypothetical protein
MFLYIDTPVDPVTSYDITVVVLFVIFCIGAFLLRNTIFGFLWVIVKAFFIALALIIVAGKIKDSIKDLFKD